MDAASTEGRDPIEDIYAINKELENYNEELAKRPQIIAANKIDCIYVEEGEESPIDKIRKEFEPQGMKVFPISAVSGEGLKELLYYVSSMLEENQVEPIVFEQEYFPELEMTEEINGDGYTVEQDPEDATVFVVEGPKIEKMLGYTNLDSEKGFAFFQKFLKEQGILDKLKQQAFPKEILFVCMLWNLIITARRKKMTSKQRAYLKALQIIWNRFFRLENPALHRNLLREFPRL